jgi:hydrogenase-4 component E
MTGLINTFALHALVVSMSVAWQALIQHAPHLYITAAIALVIKAVVIPVALRRMVVRLGIHRTIEPVVSIGLTMLAAIGLIALSIMVMLPITQQAGTLAREDLSFALSVILLGLLLMSSRRNPVSPVIGRVSQRRFDWLAASFRQAGLSRTDAQHRARLAYAAYVGFLQLNMQLHQQRLQHDEFEGYVDHVMSTLIPNDAPADPAAQP